MSILVTGSSGRVGSAIVNGLVASKRAVVGVDMIPAKTTHHVFDLTDHQRLAVLAQKADAIVHCAALHAPHVGRRPDSEFWAVNVGVTEALLKYSRSDAPMVLTSSTSIYGHALLARNTAVWVDESLLPRPRDIYDETKLAAERLLRQYALQGRPLSSLRISRCFPESERDMALYRLYRGVDIRDVVQAHLLAIEQTSGYAEFVISGPPVFVRSDTDRLYKQPWPLVCDRVHNAEALFVRRKWRPPTSIDRVYSSELAARELGYSPQYGFDEFVD